jgi:hypothetical protein
MAKIRGIILALATTAAVLVAVPPCRAGDSDNSKDSQGIWSSQDEGGVQRPGRGRGQRRFELTENEIDRIMESYKKRDPAKAKELEALRKKNPEEFRNQLWEHARPELEKIGRERWEKWLLERRAAFLDWLGQNAPDETEELTKLKEADPNLYNKKYDLVRRRYGRIFDESRRNPEWAQVLLEDVKLQKRQDELVARIKATRNKNVEKRLTGELENVVAQRYDVILRRRQMAYERLLKRLDDLKNQIKNSRNDILKYQDAKIKGENVKQRTKDLLEKKTEFAWD